jgi:hypothetical protein
VIIAGDELTSLNEAKGSQDWPEWQRAMNDELQLFNKKGTWDMVDNPLDAVLLLSKCTFTKKHDKEGGVV